MNDEILLIKIKNGDDEAFKELLNNYHKMIYRIINNFLLDKGDFTIDKEELYQEASLILYKAVFTYEKDKNMLFSSYAYLLIRSKISNLLRDYARVYNEEMYSLDNNFYYDRYLKYTINEDPVKYHKELEFKRNLDSFIENLNKEDREILRLKYDECSYKDISEYLDISTKRIDNRLTSLKKRFNNYISNK